ncbi:uncharacterized protein MCYG_05466 [Microsporum canis CBS 113480]|uniref:Uncharacterized protein n=1 Tax=Arthroderma otae (strain ATCC MYA-4605 / CBS 113480) TaxID=554155 RepID=C5FRZ4_ARTOC|nr:uncharacterized protein MCYG_05466 [Microsporum canis CBS 113480]EEQ32647.1 predicted protein [Microsporum canis CBS 113480]
MGYDSEGDTGPQIICATMTGIVISQSMAKAGIVIRSGLELRLFSYVYVASASKKTYRVAEISPNTSSALGSLWLTQCLLQPGDNHYKLHELPAVREYIYLGAGAGAGKGGKWTYSPFFSRILRILYQVELLVLSLPCCQFKSNKRSDQQDVLYIVQNSGRLPGWACSKGISGGHVEQELDGLKLAARHLGGFASCGGINCWMFPHARPSIDGSVSNRRIDGSSTAVHIDGERCRWLRREKKNSAGGDGQA